MNDPLNSQGLAALDHAAELLQEANALIVAAGAGMGVDSGLPDFRGREGFWRAYPALREAGLDFTQIASPTAFRTMPDRAWGFYGHRLALYRATQPHAGFELLRRWGGRMLHGLTVFTSNVDGQFQRAGFDEGQMHECHGSIHHLQCLRPCCEAIWPADGFVPEVDEVNSRLLNAPPRSPWCDGLARPNILMFGDDSWISQRTEAQAARQDAWLVQISRPLIIEIGAGVAIPSVRHFGHRVLCDHGGRMIRINPRESTVPSSQDVGLPMGAVEALSALAERLGPSWRP